MTVPVSLYNVVSLRIIFIIAYRCEKQKHERRVNEVKVFHPTLDYYPRSVAQCH